MQNIFTIKRIIIGLVSLVVLFLAVGAIWYYFLRSDGTSGNSNDGGFLSNLFPESGNKDLPIDENKQTNEEENLASIPEDLNTSRGDSYQIAVGPVAGAISYKGGVRYVNRSSGNFIEIDSDGKNEQVISSNKISGVYDAIFSPQGTKAIVRYSSGDRGEALIASITGSSSVQTFILPLGIKDVAFSPKGDKIAYVLPSGDDASVITATTENKNQTKRLTMKYSDWKIGWPNDLDIYLQTAPSAYLDGFLYKLSLSGNALTKIIGPLPGLLSQTSSKNILFSSTEQETKSFILNISDLSGKNSGILSIKTFPEKCVWSKKVKEVVFCAVPLPLPTAIYPDDWYKGKVSFGDVVVKINTASRAINSFLLPETLDATKLFLSEDEATLFFINKADESLWKLKLP